MLKHKCLHIVLWGLFFILIQKQSLAITITANTMQHFKEEDKYIAQDNVTIVTDKSKITAKHAVFYRQTSIAHLKGNVHYEDDTVSINAESAEINISTRLGNLNNAFILIKDPSKQADPMLKKEYRLHGSKVTRLAENHFYFKTISMTTCEYDNYTVADWCFKADDTDIIIGKSMTAKNVTYYIKDLPVIYSPFIWAPVLTHRQSGLLPPLIGNSNTKGFKYSHSYFWAIDENIDATATVDYFSKAGVALGAELRYIYPSNVGKWHTYRIRDTQLNKQFVELKGNHRYKSDYLEGYADVNYVNDKDFYREYFSKYNDIDRRFLQSSIEIFKNTSNTRIYALTQTYKDLKLSDRLAPQKLSEIGFYLKPLSFGSAVLSSQGTVTNFYRRSSEHGQRLDIGTELTHSIGSLVTFTQTLSFSETAYNLYNSNQNTTNFESVSYTAKTFAKFYKKYARALHVVEPSIGYEFKTGHQNITLLDSLEIKNKTSQISAGVQNLIYYDNVSMYLKISQYYNLLDRNANEQKFIPLRIDAAVFAHPLTARLDITQDINKRRTDTLNSEFAYEVSKMIQLNIGERYNRADNFLFYRGGFNIAITKHWVLKSNFDYDEKLKELRNFTYAVKYQEKCWALNLHMTRRPGYENRPSEYSFFITFELKGIG